MLIPICNTWYEHNMFLQISGHQYITTRNYANIRINICIQTATQNMNECVLHTGIPTWHNLLNYNI